MKIGFIGAGNMGYALLQAAMNSEDADIYVYDKDEKKAKSIASHTGVTFATADEIAEGCDYIFLGVKPNVIESVINEIKDSLGDRATLVSMAAGVKIKNIEAALEREDVPIIRIMPNLAVSIGAGTILWCANGPARGEKADIFIDIMGEAGEFSRIEESRIDAGSAISGCGPAFAYMFIDALADGGVACGLSREAALEYAAQTLIGAARMTQETGRHPAELKDEVCSPGGSTIAGVLSLEEGAFRATVANAVKASYKRTKELVK